MSKDVLGKDFLKTVSDLRNSGKTWPQIAKLVKFTGGGKKLRNHYLGNIKKPRVKILLLDIETAPILAYVWGLYDQNIPSNMVLENTSMLAWAAKWYGQKKIYYEDVSKQKNFRDDSKLLVNLWKMIDEADILVGHNLAKFDKKKTNARFLVHKMEPVSNSRVIDTLKIARKYFSFDSNKLVDLAKILKLKNQKYSHSQFHGNELWVECLKGNKKAWREMRAYNPQDVIVLEELFNELMKHDNSINFNVFSESIDPICFCGCKTFTFKGYANTNTGRFHRLKCDNCGHKYQSKQNLLTLEKRKAMLK